MVKLDWIDKQQIVDVKEGSEGVFLIDAIANKSAKVLVVRIYRLVPSEGYYVEVRERLGADANMDRRIRMGVLILQVDGMLDPREGGVVVIDSHPKSYNPNTPSAEFYDAPFSIGRNETVAFINRVKNLSIMVLSKVGYSYKVKVGDAVSGEKAIEANDAIVKAEDAIEKARKESRLKGLDDAESQLDKAKAAYGEAMFKDAVEFAKLTTELANIATVMPTTVTTVTGTTSITGTESTIAPTVPLNIVIPAIAVGGILVAVGVLITLRKGKKTT